MTVKNPNALAGGAAGLIGAQLVLNLAKLLGWDISPGWAVTIAAGASYVVLYVGRNGLAGVWGLLKFGTGGPPKAGP